MIVIRICAMIFAALACLTGFLPIIRGQDSLLAGELWFILWPASLNLIQAIIERYIWEALWDPVLLWTLEREAWSVFAALSMIFVLIWLYAVRRRN